jgi:hypothetical protein
MAFVAYKRWHVHSTPLLPPSNQRIKAIKTSLENESVVQIADRGVQVVVLAQWNEIRRVGAVFNCVLRDQAPQ